jgi:hypothetical protein
LLKFEGDFNLKSFEMKYFTVILGLIIFWMNTMSQCTPSNTWNAPGNYGSNGKGILKSSKVYKPYNEVITVIPPLTYDTFGLPIAVDSIRIASVLNLPNGLSYKILNNIVRAQTRSCILLEGTPDANNTIGNKEIVLELFYFANGGNSIKHPQKLVMKLDSAISSSLFEDKQVSIDKNALKIFPNPCSNYLVVSFSIPDKQQTFRYEIVNHLGKSTIMSGRLGKSDNSSAKINVEGLSNGMYYLNIFSDQARVKSFVFVKQ